MRKSIKAAIGLVLLLGLSTAGAIVLLWETPFKSYSSGEKFVLIPRGASSLAISRQLAREGIVRHWVLFLGYVKTLQRAHPLQAGEYRFTEPLTVPQVAEKLVRGMVYYHEVTIPEGFSVFDIADLLSQLGLATADSFRSASGNPRFIHDMVPEARSLEGFLFPDTYRFPRGVTAEEITRKMVDQFRQVVAHSIASELKNSPLSLQELVTLASLIEKETGIDEERELVSSVFHNRLNHHMPLQSDPTVIYAAKLRGTYRGEILQKDLDQPSPYNTYLHAGLPPGPIANPGLRSILAALKSASTNYLYFVSTGQSRHVFSATLEQHSRAVAIYRRELKKSAPHRPGKL